MRSTFLQSFNADADPIFIDLRNAQAFWTLPRTTKLSDLTTLTHITDEGKVYYESLSTGAVTWSLVVDGTVIIAEAVSLASDLLDATREETEEIIGKPFPEKESEEQMIILQQYCEDPESYVEPDNNESDTENYDANALMNELRDENIENQSFTGGDEEVLTARTNNSTENVLEQYREPAQPVEAEDDDDDYYAPLPIVKKPSQIAEEHGVSLILQRDKQQKWTVKAIHRGYLSKNARQSARNWKKRYMILTPYYLAYYASEKDTKTPKGEIPITGGTQMIKDESVVGFGFKIITGNEQLLVSASKENERKEWMEKISHVVTYAQSFIMDTLIEINASKVNLKPDDISNIDTSKYEVQKCFIYADEYLTVHPNATNLSTVEKVINILHSTVMKRKKHQKIIYEINDSSNSSVFIGFSSIPGDNRLQKWLDKLGEVITIKELPVDAPPEPASASAVTSLATSGTNSAVSAVAAAPQARDATSRASIMFNIASVIDDFEDDEIWEQNSKGVWFAHIVHTGFLQKQARQSGRNWKRRYFKLTPFYLSYSENDRSEPKGSIAMSSHCLVENDLENTSSSAFGFKIISPIETMHLTATTDTERTMWMTYIAAAIEYSRKFTLEYLSIVDHVKYAAKHRNDIVHDITTMSKFEEFKFLVLADKFLSIHPTKEDITKIDRILRLESTTKARRLLHSAFLYELVDSKGVTIWLHFNDMTSLGRKVYETWKEKLSKCIDFQESVQPPFSNPQATYSSASSATAVASNNTSSDSNAASKPLMFDAALFMKQQTRWSADLTVPTPQSEVDTIESETKNNQKATNDYDKYDGDGANDLSANETVVSVKPFSTLVVESTPPEPAPKVVNTVPPPAPIPPPLTSPSVQPPKSNTSTGGAKNALEMAAARKQRKSNSGTNRDSISKSADSKSESLNSSSAASANSAISSTTMNSSPSGTNSDPLLSGYKSYMRSNLSKLSSYLDDEEGAPVIDTTQSQRQGVHQSNSVNSVEDVVTSTQVAPVPPPPPPPPPPPKKIVVEKEEEPTVIPPTATMSLPKANTIVTPASNVVDKEQLVVEKVEKPVDKTMEFLPQVKTMSEKVPLAPKQSAVKSEQTATPPTAAMSSTKTHTTVIPAPNVVEKEPPVVEKVVEKPVDKSMEVAPLVNKVSEKVPLAPTQSAVKAEPIEAVTTLPAPPSMDVEKINDFDIMPVSQNSAISQKKPETISDRLKRMQQERKEQEVFVKVSETPLAKDENNDQLPRIDYYDPSTAASTSPSVTTGKGGQLNALQMAAKRRSEKRTSSFDSVSSSQTATSASGRNTPATLASSVSAMLGLATPTTSPRIQGKTINSTSATTSSVSTSSGASNNTNAGMNNRNSAKIVPPISAASPMFATRKFSGSSKYLSNTDVNSNNNITVEKSALSSVDIVKNDAPPVSVPVVSKEPTQTKPKMQSMTSAESVKVVPTAPAPVSQSIAPPSTSINSFFLDNVEDDEDELDDQTSSTNNNSNPVVKPISSANVVNPVSDVKPAPTVNPVPLLPPQATATPAKIETKAEPINISSAQNAFFLSNVEDDDDEEEEEEIEMTYSGPISSSATPSAIVNVMEQMQHDRLNSLGHEKTLLERSASKDFHLSPYQEMASTTNQYTTMPSDDPLRLVMHNSFTAPVTSPSQRSSFNTGNNAVSVGIANDMVSVGDVNNTSSLSGSYVNALDMFKVAKNKPVVRIVFDNYASRDQYIDSVALQTLAYDLAYYLSMEEVSRFTDKYSSSETPLYHQKVLSYDDFQVFWRDHPYFKTVRLQDPMMKRRVVIASKFKSHDLLGQGYIKASQFDRLYQELVDEGYLSQRRHRSNSIVKKIDGEQKGKITLSRFIEWIDMNVSDATQKQSTLGKIWGSFSSNSSRQPSPLPTQLFTDGSPTLNASGNSTPNNFHFSLSRAQSAHNSRSTSPSDLPTFRLRNNSHHTPPSQQLFASTGSNASSVSSVTGVAVAMKSLPFETESVSISSVKNNTENGVTPPEIVHSKPNADFIPISAMSITSPSTDHNSSSRMRSVSAASGDDAISITSSVAELGSFTPTAADISTQDNSSANNKKKTPFTRRRSVLTKKQPSTTTTASSTINNNVTTNAIDTTELDLPPPVEDLPDSNDTKNVALTSNVIPQSTNATHVTNNPPVAVSSTIVAEDGGETFTNPMARLRAKQAVSTNKSTSTTTSTITSTTANSTAVNKVELSEKSRTTNVAAASTNNAKEKNTNSLSLDTVTIDNNNKSSNSTAQTKNESKPSRSVFASMKKKKQEQEQTSTSNNLSIVTDDALQATAASNNGMLSSDVTDTTANLSTILPPNMSILQQKKKPVKTFKVISHHFQEGALAAASSQKAVDFVDSDSESIHHPHLGHSGRTNHQRRAKFLSPTDYPSTLETSSTAGSTDPDRPNHHQHHHPSGSLSHDDLALMMLSTEDFVSDFRRRFKEFVDRLPVDFTASLTAKAQQQSTHESPRPASSSSSSSPNTQQPNDAAKKARLFTLLQNPELLTDKAQNLGTSEPSTSVNNNNSSSSTGKSGTVVESEDQAQLSLYHKMLLSRHLLWDGLQHLPQVYTASQKRILAARLASEQRIQEAAETAIASITKQETLLNTLYTSLTQRHHENVDRTQRQYEELQALQTERRVWHTDVHTKSLIELVWTLKRKHESLHAQHRQLWQQRRSVLVAHREVQDTTHFLRHEAMQREEKQLEEAMKAVFHGDKQAFQRWKKERQSAKEAKHLLHAMTMEEHDALLQAREETRKKKITRLLSELTKPV